MHHLIEAYFHLQPLPKTKRNIKEELLRYFAVGLVSCLEGYYRSIIKELIDHGPPYRENAQKLEDMKLDIRTITEMHDKHITAGEVISHLVTLSSFEDVQKHMSVILGFDYYENLQPRRLSSGRIYGEFHPRARDVLRELYSDRNIACHELNPRIKWTFRRVVKQWRVAWHTIEANEGLLRKSGIRKVTLSGRGDR